MPVFELSDKIIFPPPAAARRDGLLAIGGDLSPERLLLAYRMGIFPWFSDDQPYLWWSPDPRLVLFPRELSVSRRLARIIRNNRFAITSDTVFEKIITACAQVRRKKGEGTWIGEEMIRSYCELHELGYAHSMEAWYQGNLAGGLYGVSLGGTFFGESMFTEIDNASKVLMVALARQLESAAFDMIDCQVVTPHLIRFGARKIARTEFLAKLERSMQRNTLKGKWGF